MADEHGNGYSRDQDSLFPQPANLDTFSNPSLSRRRDAHVLTSKRTQLATLLTNYTPVSLPP